jgi:hypothetical protein
MNHLHPKTIKLAPLSLLTEADLLEVVRKGSALELDAFAFRFVVYEPLVGDVFERGRFTRLHDWRGSKRVPKIRDRGTRSLPPKEAA